MRALVSARIFNPFREIPLICPSVTYHPVTFPSAFPTTPIRFKHTLSNINLKYKYPAVPKFDKVITTPIPLVVQPPKPKSPYLFTVDEIKAYIEKKGLDNFITTNCFAILSESILAKDEQMVRYMSVCINHVWKKHMDEVD